MGVYTFLGFFGVVAIAISCWYEIVRRITLASLIIICDRFGIINIISNSAISLHSDLLTSTMRYTPGFGNPIFTLTRAQSTLAFLHESRYRNFDEQIQV